MIELLAGRYELERRAGEGGMGTVFLALDRQSGARVAVKVLARGSRRRDMFEREARMLASLDHPGLVRYLDHGVTPDGTPYLVMEWLEGEDLAARLARGPLDLAGTLELASRVAHALADAHRAGIVHRDIKPSNLFLLHGRLDHVRVLDFGAATIGADERTGTSTSEVVGTLGYAPPEQTHDRGAVDARADVFALGCVLFECLAGRRAFVASDAIATLAQVVWGSAPPLDAIRDDVPEPLARLVARMLQKDPNERPNDAAEVALSLATLRGTNASDAPVTWVWGDGDDALLSRFGATRFDAKIAVSGGSAFDRAHLALALAKELRGRVAIGAPSDAPFFVDATNTALLSETYDPHWKRHNHSPPLAGRMGELRVLEAALAECIEESAARTITLTGPEGMGKSRLLEALGEGTRMRARRPPGVRGEAVHETRDGEGPLLVVDDAQWLDEGTAATLAARLNATAPLLLVLGGREPFPPHVAVLAARDSAGRIRLGELGAKSAEALLRSLGVTEGIAAMLRDARGRPRLLVHLAMLAAGRSTEGAVFALATAGLDALDPDALRVLHAASANAEPFLASAIDGDDAARWLDALTSRGVLTRDEQGYRFADPLVKRALRAR